MLKAAEMDAEKIEPVRRPGVAVWITKRYTWQGVWSLFLMCAFPVHAWTLILAFRDMSWLTDRTNAWDALGVASYGLVFALVESLVLCAGMLLLGYLVSGRWDSGRRVALLTVLTLVLLVWAMLDQLFFLADARLPSWILGILVHSPHPLWVMYGIVLVLVGVTALVPAWFVLRSERVYRGVSAMIERLSVLSAFYLLLDVIGLVIVSIRNI